MPILFLFLFANQSKFYFYLQISPFLLFLAVWSIFTFCRLVRQFYFFAEWSLGQNSVQGATQAIKARCHSLIGPKAHRAAYKRPATVQVRKKKPQNACHITNTTEFSLSIQLGSKFTKLKKSQEHEEQFHKP